MFRDRLPLAFITISLISLQVSLWTIMLKLADMPSQIPLWYTAPSNDQLAPLAYIWLIPGIAAGIWLANLLLGWKLYRKNPDVTYLLGSVSAACCILAAIATLKIILLYTDIL